MHRRALLVMPSLALAGAARAQSAGVRLVVPYPPGGGIDVSGRIFAEALTQSQGVPWLVENRSGANGAVGSAAVARAEADGRTLLCNSDSHLLARGVMARVPYDPIADFTPIGMIGSTPNVLVCNANLAPQTIKAFLEFLKQNPGKLSYGSAGAGSLTHLTAELFKMQTNSFLVHIPYRGIAPAITDLIGGQTQMMFPGLAAALPHIRGGRIRALAVTGAQRHPQLKDVPTLEEAGLKGFDAQQWYGVVGPANMPAGIVKQLNDGMAAVLAQPDFKDKLSAEAVELMPMKPAEFAAFMKKDIARWTALAKARNIQLDS